VTPVPPETPGLGVRVTGARDTPPVP
jgi:hypothetical protein